MNYHSIKKHFRSFIIIIVVCLAVLVLPVFASQAAELKLPSGLKVIASQAFYGDTSLDTVTVQKGTERIESEAFAHSSVKKVRLPASVTYIADDAFDGCQGVGIVAQIGTYAYQWAEDHDYPLEPDDSVPEVIAPDSIRAGTDLTVQITGPENAIRHSVYVVNKTTGEYCYAELNKATGSVSFSGYNFDAGTTYRLTVYTVSKDFLSFEPVTKDIRITGQRPAAPSFTIPKKMKYGQYVSIDKGQYKSVVLKCKYYATDGTLLETSERWGDIDTWSLGEAGGEGTINLVYSACKDGLWTEWSDPFVITVTNTQCSIDNISFPDTVENGADFDVGFDYENMDKCAYSIINKETSNQEFYEEYWPRTEDGQLNLLVPTRDLDQGHYLFKLYFRIPRTDLEMLVYQKDFEVTGSKASAPNVICDNTEVLTETRFYFSIDTTDTEAVCIKRIDPYDYVRTETTSSQGQTTRWWDDAYDIGIYTYYFSVLKDDKWSAWSSPIEVHSRAKPTLSTATIHVQNTSSAGQDIAYSFDEVEHATKYRVYLESAYGGNTVYELYYDEAHPNTELIIPGYLLSAGRYDLSVIAKGDGYYDSFAHKTVTIQGTRPLGPDVTVDGPIYIRIPAVFTISAEDAEALQVQYRIYYNEEYEDEWWGENFQVPVSGDISQWSYAFDESEPGRKLIVSFSAKQNGIWSAWTTNTYTIAGLPPLDPAVIHMEDTIEAGTDFSITVDPVTNATSYYYSVKQGEKNYRGNDSDSPIGEIRINGYELDPGEYIIEVRSYSDDYTTSISKKMFTVIGTRTGAPNVSVDKHNVSINEYYTFTIITTDVDALVVRKDRFSDFEGISIQGNETRWSDYSWYAGDTEYQFAILQNGKWSAWSNAITITATANTTPYLGKPIIESSESITTGTDYSFRFNPVQNATSYKAYFSSAYGGNTLYYWDEDFALPNTDLTVPGYLLNSGSYTITVKAYASGYSSSSSTVYIAATGTRPSGPDVSVEEPLRIKSNAVFTVNTEGAEALQVKYQYKSQYTTWSEYSESISVTGDTSQWTHTIDEYKQGVNLTVSFSVKHDGVWSLWKTNTYTIEGLPPLNPVTIHVAETIEAGTDFSITIDPVTNATDYQYRLYLSNTSVRSGNISSSPAVIRINGYELDPGEYTVKVWASSNDYSTSESTQNFTVSGTRAVAPAVSVDKPNVFTGEYYSFTIETTGADALVVKYGNNYYGITIQGDNTQWSHYFYEWSPGSRDYSFAILKGGKWSEWSNAIRITATQNPAPITTNLDKAVIQATESFATGSDYSFRFAPVENATSYEATFSSAYADNTIYRWYEGSALPDTDLTVPGYLLNSGSYIITVNAYASGYSSSSNSVYVAASGTRPAGPDATVEEPLRIKSNVVFTINTEDAEDLRVKYQYRSQNTTWSEYSESISVTGDTSQWTHQVSESRQGTTLTVSFSVKRDGVWSQWKTNTYTIEGLPPLDPAVIHIDETIDAGRDVIISIDPVENATSYQYYLYLPNGNYWDSYSDNISELYYYGYNLNPGEYTFKIWAYSNDYATSTSEKTFTIVGTKPAAPDASVNKTNVNSSERFMFTIDTNGADALRYRVSNNGIYSINVFEGETDWQTYQYSSGTYNYCFAVRRNGVWSEWTEPITITVSDYNPLEAPEISVTSLLENGRDLVISLSEVDSATSYRVYLDNSDGSIIFSNTIYPDGISAISFPGYRISSGTYTIRAYASNANASSPTTQKIIHITSSDLPDAPSVTPPQNTIVPSNSYIAFTIDTTNADCIAVRYFNVGNTNNLYFDSANVQEGEDQSTWREFFDVASRKYSFAVRKDGVWSEWSAFYTITREE